METITELLRNNGSDKVSYHSYGPTYEELLNPIKYTAKNVLEIGILEGASIRAFREFFPNATIYGIDNEEHRLAYGDRIKSYKADTTERDRFMNLCNSFPLFDFIVDDGSHQVVEQIFALGCLWHKLKSGGIYVIEDLYKPEYLNLFLGFNNVQTKDLVHIKGQHDDRLVIIKKD